MTMNRPRCHWTKDPKYKIVGPEKSNCPHCDKLVRGTPFRCRSPRWSRGRTRMLLTNKISYSFRCTECQQKWQMGINRYVLCRWFDDTVYGYMCIDCGGAWKVYQDEYHNSECPCLKENKR